MPDQSNAKIDRKKRQYEREQTFNAPITYPDGTTTTQSPGGGGGGGGGGFAQTTETSDYTASDGDSVWADSSSSSVTVTLPTPNTSVRVRVLNIDNTNGVTLSENGGEGINDQSGSHVSITLSEGESVEVESDGSTWWVV